MIPQVGAPVIEPPRFWYFDQLMSGWSLLLRSPSNAFIPKGISLKSLVANPEVSLDSACVGANHWAFIPKSVFDITPPKGWFVTKFGTKPLFSSSSPFEPNAFIPAWFTTPSPPRSMAGCSSLKLGTTPPEWNLGMKPLFVILYSSGFSFFLLRPKSLRAPFIPFAPNDLVLSHSFPTASLLAVSASLHALWLRCVAVFCQSSPTKLGTKPKLLEV